MVRKYNTGPSATVSFGQSENEKICSYISNDSYPFQNPTGPFGITFNPFEKGQVQTCPYHSMIGTREWLGLRDYLDAVKNNRDITDDNVKEWLDAAIRAETMVTRGAFDLQGYEHCLMRHSKKSKIDLYIAGVNAEMAEKREAGAFDINDPEYFSKLLENLGKSIKVVSGKVNQQ